jgi:nucleotide-binding universal stress UspA family protein
MTILFAYDGSESADAALRAAATIVDAHAADAIVLSVWEPLLVEALRAARFGAIGVPSNAEEIDQRSERDTQQVAEHGARLAGELGFTERPLARADERSIPDAILAAADEGEADLIVLGARGLAGVHAFLGSVSNRVLQHAHTPVLIIPPKQAPESQEGSHQEAAAGQPA